MAQLKHIAIRTGDVAKTAAFYKEAFDLEEVGKGHSGGVYPPTATSTPRS